MRSFRGLLKEWQFRRIVEETIPAAAELLGFVPPFMIREILDGATVSHFLKARREDRVSMQEVRHMIWIVRAPWWRRLGWRLGIGVVPKVTTEAR